MRSSLAFLLTAICAFVAVSARAQTGFPDALRRYSDNGSIPFRIGTAVQLDGSPSRFPPNGYGPGILTSSARDLAMQELVRGQFNNVECGNETKMMSLWTGGALRVAGHYVAKTNLFDLTGPLARACAWAASQPQPLTVRGHCMVYNQGYTLPSFPAGQPPLFVAGGNRPYALNSAYTTDDLRDMLRSYVQQTVDATLVQNAKSRREHHYKVVIAWDVTNEVVSDDDQDAELPGAGFSYKSTDMWYHCGPHDASSAGYDYVGDIYRWAASEMQSDIGKTIAGHKIAAADKFALYYNEYNLEWNPSKMRRTLNMIRHIRRRGGVVDGLGFQAHISANGLDVAQFGKNIDAAIAENLRFSMTEADCAIDPTPKAGAPSVEQQETGQGEEFGELVALCRQRQKSCDLFQIWGATDDGSWLSNRQATPFTRWVEDSRPGATHGQEGYWPKQGQFSPITLCDPSTGESDTASGRTVSDAYSRMRDALEAP